MKLHFVKSRIITAGISLLVGLFFVMAGWQVYQEYDRMKDYSGRTTGYVTHKHFLRASDGQSVYYLDYYFYLADGNKMNATKSVLQQEWDLFKVNDILEIRYDQHNPERSYPVSGGGASPVLVIFIFLLGAVFIIFGVLRIKSGFNPA